MNGRRAPEFQGGQNSENGFLEAAEEFLGPNYITLPNGRYRSVDGFRQVRYGSHEVKNSQHHGHFEVYDRPEGTVIENSSLEITSD
jgi:hypothetical protein